MRLLGKMEQTLLTLLPPALVEEVTLLVLCVCMFVCVLLDSCSVQITTYWLLFCFVGYRGFVGYIVCSLWGYWLTKPTKNTDTFGQKICL